MSTSLYCTSYLHYCAVSPVSQHYWSHQCKKITLYHAAGGVQTPIWHALEVLPAATIVLGAVANWSKGGEQVIHCLEMCGPDRLFPVNSRWVARFSVSRKKLTHSTILVNWFWHMLLLSRHKEVIRCVMKHINASHCNLVLPGHLIPDTYIQDHKMFSKHQDSSSKSTSYQVSVAKISAMQKYLPWILTELELEWKLGIASFNPIPCILHILIVFVEVFCRCILLNLYRHVFMVSLYSY